MLLRIAFGIALFFSVAGAAQAAVTSPKVPALSPVALQYTIYAGGLKVVDVSVNYSIGSKDYSISSMAHTRGMWEDLVPWRNMISSHGTVRAGYDLRPQSAKYDSVWREKLRSVEMSFNTAGDISTIAQPPHKKDSRTEATAQQIRGALDPLTALVEVMAKGASHGCTGQLPAFDGRRLYNLVLTNKGEETLQPNEYSLFSGKAVRCEVRFEPVAGFPEKETKAGFWTAKDNTDKRNPLIIWLAQLAPTQPTVAVRVQTTVSLGTIIAHINHADVVAPLP